MAKRPIISSDSLELLLDTMCNTFGGVMFIAIALVIVSTFIPKVIKNIDSQELTEHRIQELQTKIETLHQELKKQQLSISLKNELVDRFKNSPHLDDIQRLAALKDKNSKLLLLTDEETSAAANFMIALNRTKRKRTELDHILNQELLDISNVSDDITLIGDEMKKLQRQLDDFKLVTPKDTRVIGLAPLTKTTKTPFIMVLDSDKLYRVNDRSGEIIFDGERFASSNDVKLNPVFQENQDIPIAATIELLQGKGVHINPEQASDILLRRIFNAVDKSKKFIFLEVNKNSFKSFIKVKKFLRKAGYKLYWFPADRYMISFGNADYKAR